MRIASLGSGSRGNATLVEVDQTLLLIDNGFSLQETHRRLAKLDKHPEDISAILVTHEHGDHIAGVGRLARKYKIPVWLTEGSRKAAEQTLADVSTQNIFNCHEVFTVDAVQIQPVIVPHDAREPSQFVFTDGKVRLGLLTDTGSITPHIISMLSHCHGLIIESNHDDQMLEQSPYPAYLKQRISGRLGHLGNHQAADLLTQINTGKLVQLIAAHLSELNNTPEQVRHCLAAALNCEKEWIGIADQEQGFAWRDIQ